MRVLIKTDKSGNDWLEGFDYACVTVTKELAQLVMKRRKVLEALRREDKELRSGEFWDTTANFFSLHGVDDDDKVSDELTELLGDDAYLILDDYQAGEIFKEPEASRGEIDRMALTERGVCWACSPKHTDSTVETLEIPYELFEKCL